jgi:hypothetical protein
MSAIVAQELGELRRANAELLRKRDTALARRNHESGEGIAHQAATVDLAILHRIDEVVG